METTEYSGSSGNATPAISGSRKARTAGSGQSIRGAWFGGALLATLVLASALRGIFPVADPPWRAGVGIVWHDEGTWVHNARNRALFGAWKLDEWNPMYITPVLTGLEYASFRMFGVGLWQARLVSEVAGVLSVLLLGLAVSRVAGRLAGLLAAALLATNYVYVMYDRAALMEATMIAFMVAAWYCYVRAHDSPVWGLLVGPAVFLAYFTKAAAAFLVAAIGLDAVLSLALTSRHAWLGPTPAGGSPSEEPETSSGRPGARVAAWFTLAGLLGAGLISLLLFVAPNWQEYRFYNWQVSVTRKPSYTVKALLDRVSWFPILHDFFTRMWLVSILAAGGTLGLLARWRRVHPGERLLLLWLGLGSCELFLHDVGNERRLVFLIPALVALAAIVLGRDRRLLAPEVVQLKRLPLLLTAPLVLYVLYVTGGGLLRLAFLYEVRQGILSPDVRLSAAVAVVAGIAVYATWPAVPRWVVRNSWSAPASLLLACLVLAGDVAQFTQWAWERTEKNYAAMRLLGEWLPPGTLVQGKLANGLSLENRIRPIFVGRGFGNYLDRLSRDDARYLVTYIAPEVGYEGPVIKDVLDAYPNRRVLHVFDVAETPGGHDQAALFDKGPRRQ
jgi:Dolichyl-phosphate-mannose-protein mannosyltransferase